MSGPYNLVTILGPTASGKTAFAAHLASQITGEVISADSRQVYRQMNLGTGKDYTDYRVSGIQIPFHLTDLVDPGYRYSVFEYQRDFFRVFRDIQSRKKFPVLCGGSGMYLEAATRGYRLIDVPRDESLRTTLASKTLDELSALLSTMRSQHNTTDTDNRERALRAIEIAHHNRNNPPRDGDLPVINPLFIGIRYDRGEERNRITVRLEERLRQGMVAEVEQLLASGLTPAELQYYGLEYRYITLYLQGLTDYPTMVSRLNTAIHQFAKRQRTWFRRMEREGTCIHWLEGQIPMPQKIDMVMKLMGSKQ
jgi:tRNA dimethylallyltransferase